MRVALLLPLLLAACADQVNAPSLLPRPAEANRPDDPVPAPEATAITPVQQADIARLTAQARAADAEFAKAIRGANPSAPRGSEAWIVAQASRSASEVARGPALDALTALDDAIAKATSEGRDPAPYATARAEIQRLVDAQAARLDTFSN